MSCSGCSALHEVNPIKKNIKIYDSEMIKRIMKRQVFLHLAEFYNGFFCFAFEKLSFSLPMLLVVYLFMRENVQTAVHRCS